MKKLIYLLLIVPVLFVMAYSTNKSSSTYNEQVPTNETPEALLDDKEYRTSSYSKRGNSDIITKLYQEALEKNSKLEKLNEAINNMGKWKSDSLRDYNNFSRTNNNYWTTAKRYINQLEDSGLKQSTLQTFLAIESNYRSKMAEYEKQMTVIKKKTLSLNDQLTLMKLFVTGSMMKNYQNNEKPSIKTLENIIDEYDKLIEETEEFTKLAE